MLTIHEDVEVLNRLPILATFETLVVVVAILIIVTSILIVNGFVLLHNQIRNAKKCESLRLEKNLNENKCTMNIILCNSMDMERYLMYSLQP